MSSNSQEDIEKMTASIIFEARERMEEIRILANEQFEIEKKKSIDEESQKVQEEFQRRKKQVEMQKKITQSSVINLSRIKILESKYKYVQQILLEAHKKIIKLTESDEKYLNLLKKLILQGLIKLMETKVIIQCRECDVKLVKEAIPWASEEFQKLTTKKCEVTLLKSSYLPPPPEKGSKNPSCSGGIVLNSANGRIVCSNTLDNRLLLAFDNLLPEIRRILFQENN
ncbi:atpase h -transporting v1 subunit e1a-related [Anaeramoeba ignava]|uniref:Atpase h -transporting v1 subunit e1a-related n=1 Tax=Anaeramoeba ignava TaxID=1746090 RepID=A0A9Q0L5S1_ANAIG|nr:atpase h -transporting v1 subunit e1a-related [Anaeramoeba ignava]